MNCNFCNKDVANPCHDATLAREECPRVPLAETPLFTRPNCEGEIFTIATRVRSTWTGSYGVVRDILYGAQHVEVQWSARRASNHHVDGLRTVRAKR